MRFDLVKKIKIVLLSIGMCLILLGHPVCTKAASSLSISSLSVTAKNSGSTYAVGTLKYKAPSYKKVTIRVRILNSAGKYVYSKTYSNMAAASYTLTKQLTWNGKASSGNTAKVTSGKVVADGTYRMQVRISGTIKSATAYRTSTKSFKVARGGTGSEDAGTVSTSTATTSVATPRLTGDAQLDYMVEMSVRQAGVTSKMTADQAVKKIFYFISHKFKHVHDSYKNYSKKYNLTKLSSKISAYKTATDKLIASKKAVKVKLSFCTTSSYADVKNWFNARVGQCNRQADAFELMCNHIGVKSGICYGSYIYSDGSRSGHYWNWAKIGGSVYYYDVDVQLQNLARKSVTNNYFSWWYKTSKKVCAQHHAFKWTK